MKNITLTIALFYCITNLVQAQRIVLLEQFTNSGCTICATHDPATYAYVQSNPTQVIAISYHTAFPYFDSLYLENIQDAAARTAFYSVVSVPYSILDGNYFAASTPVLNPNISNTICNRAALPPSYAIASLKSELDGNTLNCSFSFESLSASNQNDSLRAHVVVIEEEVLKSSYAGSPGNNSLTSYEYVMRKMLPNASGVRLLNRNLNGVDLINHSWNLQYIKNRSELRLVAFVQNTNSKEIYGAYWVTPADVTGIKERSMNKNSIRIFPNPASNLITVNSNLLGTDTRVEIHTITGKLVYQEIQKDARNFSLSVADFEPGLYFLSLVNDTGREQSKLFIK